ncbi:MAG: hypothetical protein ACE5IW_13950 [bacterium]
MEVLTLIISGIALVIAIIAFQRTGGIKDIRRRAKSVSSGTKMVRNNLQRRVEAVSSGTQMVRNRTANTLERLERIIRGKGKDTNHQGNRAEEPETRRSARTSRRS